MVLDAKGRTFMTFALSNARLLLPGLWNSSVDKENQETACSECSDQSFCLDLGLDLDFATKEFSTWVANSS